MRRRRPAPPPPTLRAIAIDGSNVIASAASIAAARLQLALDWARQWRADLPLHLFVDHATLARLEPTARTAVRALAAVAGWTEGPAGAPVDPELLLHARAQAALVVSNDRFWQHESERRGVITIQFAIAHRRFTPFDEATWFLPTGAARRVPLGQLRAGDAEAG